MKDRILGQVLAILLFANIFIFGVFANMNPEIMVYRLYFLVPEVVIFTLAYFYLTGRFKNVRGTWRKKLMEAHQRAMLRRAVEEELKRRNGIP